LSSPLLSKNLKIKINKTIILPIVLYGCEFSSLTLREVYRLRVFENRVFRRIFGTKREEVAGGWGNEKLYASQNIIRVIKSRRMRWTGHVACIGEMSYAYGILVGKPEGKRTLRKPRHRWESNIKMDLREIGWEGVD
jgi:hypothetical protein